MKTHTDQLGIAKTRVADFSKVVAYYQPLPPEKRFAGYRNAVRRLRHWRKKLEIMEGLV